MCDPVTASLLIASTAAGAWNTQSALGKQDEAAAAGIRRQGDLREEGARRVNDRISDLNESNPQEHAQERLGQYMQALRRSRGESEGSLTDVPGASSRFSTDVAAARAASGEEARTTAGRMARMDAPAMQRQEEGFGTARLASRVEDLNRRSNMEDYLTQLRVRSIQPNPWVDAIAKLGQGFAMGRAGKAPKGADAGSLYDAGTLVDAPVGRSPFGGFA